MLWFDTVSWCTHYGFLHISLKPHSSPVPWFPVSMEVWASNYAWHLKAWATVLICTSWKHCAQARPMWTLFQETETVNNIFSLYMCREVISTYTCVQKSFLHGSYISFSGWEIPTQTRERRRHQGLSHVGPSASSTAWDAQRAGQWKPLLLLCSAQLQLSATEQPGVLYPTSRF